MPQFTSSVDHFLEMLQIHRKHLKIQWKNALVWLIFLTKMLIWIEKSFDGVERYQWSTAYHKWGLGFVDEWHQSVMLEVMVTGLFSLCEERRIIRDSGERSTHSPAALTTVLCDTYLSWGVPSWPDRGQSKPCSLSHFATLLPLCLVSASFCSYC